jgi:RNA polymerase sigma factor (sigma-70 family)
MACPAYTTYDDADLIEGIIAGEAHCFDILHDRYRSRVFAFALKRLGDPSEAEDVTQEVFLQVFRCIASYQGRSSLLTWIFGIAHNQVCRRFRRKHPVTISLDEAEGGALSSSDVPTDRQVEASRVLERCARMVESELSPTQRKVFHLKYAENRSTRAIAKQLGKSSQAVKISLFRSRRALANQAADLRAVLNA